MLFVQFYEVYHLMKQDTTALLISKIDFTRISAGNFTTFLGFGMLI